MMTISFLSEVKCILYFLATLYWICFLKYYPLKELIYVIIILIISTLYEIASYINLINISSTFMYLFLTISIYMCYFYLKIESKIIKKIYLIIYLIHLVGHGIIFLNYGINSIDFLIYTLGNTLFLIMLMLFLLDLFNSDKILKINQYLPYWVELYLICLLILEFHLLY